MKKYVILAIFLGLFTLFSGCTRTYTVAIYGNNNVICVSANVPKTIDVDPKADITISP